MASVKHGTLASPRTWHRHMDWMKRLFWKRERRAQSAAIAEEIDSGYPSYLCGCGCGCESDQCRQLIYTEGDE